MPQLDFFNFPNQFFFCFIALISTYYFFNIFFFPNFTKINLFYKWINNFIILDLTMFYFLNKKTLVYGIYLLYHNNLNKFFSKLLKLNFTKITSIKKNNWLTLTSYFFLILFFDTCILNKSLNFYGEKLLFIYIILFFIIIFIQMNFLLRFFQNFYLNLFEKKLYITFNKFFFELKQFKKEIFFLKKSLLLAYFTIILFFSINIKKLITFTKKLYLFR